jgi:hypothetical protein
MCVIPNKLRFDQDNSIRVVFESLEYIQYQHSQIKTKVTKIILKRKYRIIAQVSGSKIWPSGVK